MELNYLQNGKMTYSDLRFHFLKGRNQVRIKGISFKSSRFFTDMMTTFVISL